MPASTQTPSLIRFATAGSVDDGKSTLIGRLLYDTKSILDDQLDAIKSRLTDEIDLARLTDGLKAEREQGITIDVAYRYFSTGSRRFIIADSPGHVEYTRNMVTAASNADLAMVLIDATKGITQQTRRHLYIASLLGLQHLVVCINKMDLVNFAEERFRDIEDELQTLRQQLNFSDIAVIPVSAFHGDNVVTSSKNMPWYTSRTLIEQLESVDISRQNTFRHTRLPIQHVIRSDNQSSHRSDAGDFSRGYAGRLVSGRLAAGDPIVVLPSSRRTKIKTISTSDGLVQEAEAPQSVVVTFEDELDAGRGNVIIKEGEPATVGRTIQASICWMDDEALIVNQVYLLKQGTQLIKARVSNILEKLNLDTLVSENAAEPNKFELNQIGKVEIQLAEPLVFDPYATNKTMGSFILINQSSNATAAAGLLLELKNEDVQ